MITYKSEYLRLMKIGFFLRHGSWETWIGKWEMWIGEC